MKVLLINEVYGVLSTGRTVKELQTYLKKEGHSCIVAYAYTRQGAMGMNQELNEQCDYYMIGSAIDKKLHALCSRIYGLQGYFSTGATKKLIRFIKNQKPDVVHLGNVHGNYLNLNLLLKYLARQDIPTAIVLHDCWFYTGRCTHYTANRCYQWREGCVKCPNNRNTPTSWFFDRSKKMWKDKKKYFTKLNKLAVIGVSDWITNEARESFLKDAFLIKRIYNGIDLDIFKPMDTAELRKELNLEDKFIILSVAAIWGNAKGLNGFLKLAERLQKQHKKSLQDGKNKKECIILLVGNVGTVSNIPSNVRIIPATDSAAALARFYSVSDVYVSLSREESFGKTVAEALACGTPAVALQSTALPELIGEGCGYLVTNNSLKGVYECIEQIREKGKDHYSDRCINYARDHFSKEHCDEEYCSTYEKLMIEKSTSSGLTDK
jgi:glycosyltransferase involved in cell wall biosynthesis